MGCGEVGALSSFFSAVIGGNTGLNVGSQDKWFEAHVRDTLIAKSPTFKSNISGHYRKGYWEEMTKARQVLIDQLTSEGWEPIITDTGEIDALKRQV
jgi:hypothetical protein